MLSSFVAPINWGTLRTFSLVGGGNFDRIFTTVLRFTLLLRSADDRCILFGFMEMWIDSSECGHSLSISFDGCLHCEWARNVKSGWAAGAANICAEFATHICYCLSLSFPSLLNSTSSAILYCCAEEIRGIDIEWKVNTRWSQDERCAASARFDPDSLSFWIHSPNGFRCNWICCKLTQILSHKTVGVIRRCGLVCVCTYSYAFPGRRCLRAIGYRIC